MQRGYFKKLRDGLKILGDGELKVALKIAAHHFSKSAREKIQEAGGTAEVISA
jgi:large subunit ribosomal protein L15